MTRGVDEAIENDDMSDGSVLPTRMSFATERFVEAHGGFQQNENANARTHVCV